MSFISRFLGAEESRSIGLSLTNEEFISGVTGISSTSKAGKTVTPDSSLQLSTVYACVRILSDAVSTLPMDTYRRVDGVRRPYRPRPQFLEFNAGHLNRVDVLSQVMVSLLLHGNAYIMTPRNSAGEILYLEPLDPTRVTPKMTSQGLVFEVTSLSGVVILTPKDLLHVRAFGLPGELEGLSPIGVARETIGLGLAATEYGASFFGNGAHPGLALELPGKLSPAGADAMRESWNDKFRGSANANKLAVLTDGAKLTKITLAPNDAQFLETRKFQVNDIARVFGVPTSLLQHSDGPEMGQSIQDKNTQFVQHSLRPWVERIEAVLTDAVVSEGRNSQAFVKINMDGLLRGDHSTRYATYGAAVTQGIVTINEVRAWEDLPPVPWGDEPISVQVQEDPAGDGPPDMEAPDPDPNPTSEEEES